MSLEKFASREAGGVLDEALALARRQAVAELAERLRPALVEAALARVAGREPAAEPTPSAEPVPVPESAQRPELAPAPETATSESTGLYAYAITRAGALDLTGAEGVADGTPRLVTHAGLGLVVSEVRLSELDDLASEEPSEDSRLARLARQHDNVIRFVAEHAPVLPLRFGTVLADANGVRTLLMKRRDTALTLLDRVDGASEWGVKVLADPDRTVAAPEPATADAAGNTGDALTGTEYLARRRTALAEVDDRRRREEEALDAVHAALAVHSVDSLRRRAPVPELPLDVAYLVPDTRAAEFTAKATALTGTLAGQGLALQVTGPWPPYTFVRAAFEDVTDG